MAYIKEDQYVPGAWNAICDRCGRKRKSTEMRKTWQGYYVCYPEHFEERHPQDFVRARVEKTAPDWIRPEGGDTEVSEICPVVTLSVSGPASLGQPFEVFWEATGVLASREYTPASTGPATFTPETITIEPGSTRGSFFVTWSELGSFGVTLAAEDGCVDTGNISGVGQAPVIEVVPATSLIQLSGTVAIASNGALSNNSVYAWPPGSAVGHLGVLIVFSVPGRTISVVSGGTWQLLDSFTCSSGGAGAVCRVFGKIKEVGDTIVGVSIDGGVGFIFGQMLSYSNPNVGSYFEGAAGLTNQAPSTTVAFPAYSTEYTNAQVILISIRATTGFPWFAVTGSGNLLGLIESADTGFSQGAIQAGLAIAYAGMGVAGSVGTITASSTAFAVYSTRVLSLR